MTAPVNKKFVKEFELPKTRKSCFGFLRSRKVRALKVDVLEEVTGYSGLVRSPALMDVRSQKNGEK